VVTSVVYREGGAWTHELHYVVLGMIYFGSRMAD
jgi:hypothetical protein